jgi:hypothetical protein
MRMVSSVWGDKDPEYQCQTIGLFPNHIRNLFKLLYDQTHWKQKVYTAASWRLELKKYHTEFQTENRW